MSTKIRVDDTAGDQVDPSQSIEMEAVDLADVDERTDRQTDSVPNATGTADHSTTVYPSCKSQVVVSDSIEHGAAAVVGPDATPQDEIGLVDDITDQPIRKQDSSPEPTKKPDSSPEPISNGHVNKGFYIDIDTDEPDVAYKPGTTDPKTPHPSTPKSPRVVFKIFKDFCAGQKLSLPYLLWLFYCISGACIFYLIEKNVPVSRDSRTANERCIGQTNFWGALFYVLSACSTLGYGELYPCTVPSKILTVFYILIGIPLTLLVLAKIGKWMCRKIGHAYSEYLKCKKKVLRKLPRCSRRRGSATAENIVVSTTGVQIKVDEDSVRKTSSAVEIEDQDLPDPDELPDIPIWLGLGASLIFVIIGSVYYWAVEHYHQGESFYYSFLTFLTGDLQATRFELSIPMFFCLFMGFSMVSTTVSMIVNNINNLVSKTKRAVKREMRARKRRIAQGTPVEDLETDDEILNRVLKQHGSSWLVSMVSDQQNKGMLSVVKEEVKKVKSLSNNSVGCQTIYRLPETIRTQDAWTQDYPAPTTTVSIATVNPEYAEILVQATPTIRDHQAQVRYVPRTANKGVDNTVQTCDKVVTVYPDKQDLATQYPKMSRLRPLQTLTEEKKPIRQEKPVRLSTR